jgi:hypothetical protein
VSTEGSVEQEEASLSPAAKRARRRKYEDDRTALMLRQLFSPLPKRPGIAPLDREALRKRAADVPLEAAEQLLDEAKTVWGARQERIQSAEAKATTLLGTVAIAASLIIAGAGLILDPARVADGWREVLMVLVLLLLGCLLMCGAMASRALLSVFTISRAQVRQAFVRAKDKDPRNVQRARAVDLMARAGENLYVADYKLMSVRIAHRWYQLALIFFIALGVALAAYVLSGDLPATTK